MFEGSYVALVTPFYPDGSVNFDKLKELLEWHIENGTDGFVILGTTGENPTTEHDEDAAIVRCAVDTVRGRIPVIAGGGSNSTATALTKCRRFRDFGVDGLLCVTPYYNKSTQKGLYRHFTQLADATELPMILYNVPGRTGCSLSVETVRELARHRNIRAIKEASGNISYASHIAAFTNDEFELLSGEDGLTVPILSLGGRGVISVLANVFPRETHDMVSRYLAGDTKGALELQLRYQDFIDALFCEVNPIPVKEAMNYLGMGVGPCRMPLCEMDDGDRQLLIHRLKELGK